MPTFTVLNKQSRLGESTTGSVTIQPNPPQLLTATILISLVDMQDTATRVSLRAEVSSDGGTVWANIGASSWEGGPQDQKNNVTPAWNLYIDALPQHVGKLLRGVLAVDPRRSVGVSVTI